MMPCTANKQKQTVHDNKDGVQVIYNVGQLGNGMHADLLPWLV